MIRDLVLYGQRPSGVQLLAAPRQAGKTSFAYALMRAMPADVQVVYLNLALILHSSSTYEDVFRAALRQLGLPTSSERPSEQLYDYLQQPDTPRIVLIMDEADALEELMDKETGSLASLEDFAIVMRALKQIS
jgi:hypothetical protein